MSQNTSTAVMQRRVERPDAYDYYPTPLWATRALCERLMGIGAIDKTMTVWEPACGGGHMSRALSEYFGKVQSSDLVDRGYGQQADFLMNWHIGPPVEWVITNPPFTFAAEFALQGLKYSSVGVALLVRTAFLEGIERFNSLFRDQPPSDILQFTGRVVMHHGVLSEKGSTATAYCWLVWRKRATPGTHFHWLSTRRKTLERPGDWD